MMNNNLTYKQWFYIYLGGLVITLFVIYGIAIKPTLMLKKAYKEKLIVQESLASAPMEIKLISGKLDELNYQLNIGIGSDQDVREHILEQVSTYSERNGISVYAYPEQHQYISPSFTIESNRIVIKGTFKKLLKLIHFLETSPGFSKIVSIKYYTAVNRKSRKEELFLELFFQNMNENEKTNI